MPISKLCQEYGLSDNGLRKLCLRLKVPVPERGYWAKKAVGKARAKPQLPVLADMPESEEVAVTTSDESTPSLAMRAETKATLKQDQKFEQDVGHRVEVGGLPMHKALMHVQKRLVQRVKDWENARKKYEAALNRLGGIFGHGSPIGRSPSCTGLALKKMGNICSSAEGRKSVFMGQLMGQLFAGW